MDFTNFAELDAVKVQYACEQFLTDAVNRRKVKYDEELERNRKTCGWFWNRRPETDDEVRKRLSNEVFGYYNLEYLRYKSDVELEIEKLKRLSEVAHEASDRRTVFVTQYQASTLLPYFVEGNQLLTE